MFDNAWNIVENGGKIRDLEYKMREVSFRVVNSSFTGKSENYKIRLYRPDNVYYDDAISDVTYIDPRTSKLIVCQRELNRLYFITALRKSQGFNTLLLYIVDILSIEVDRKQIYHL